MGTLPTWVIYHGMGFYNRGPSYFRPNQLALVRAPFGHIGFVRVGLQFHTSALDVSPAKGRNDLDTVGSLDDPGQPAWEILLKNNDPAKNYCLAWWREEYPKQIAAIKAMLALGSKI